MVARAEAIAGTAKMTDHAVMKLALSLGLSQLEGQPPGLESLFAGNAGLGKLLEHQHLRDALIMVLSHSYHEMRRIPQDQRPYNLIAGLEEALDRQFGPPMVGAYVEPQGRSDVGHHASHSGTPQGGRVAPTRAGTHPAGYAPTSVRG